MTRRIISRGLRFEIKQVPKNWQERSLKQKLLFWKTFWRPVCPVTDKELYNLARKS